MCTAPIPRRRLSSKRHPRHPTVPRPMVRTSRKPRARTQISTPSVNSSWKSSCLGFVPSSLTCGVLGAVPYQGHVEIEDARQLDLEGRDGVMGIGAGRLVDDAEIVVCVEIHRLGQGRVVKRAEDQDGRVDLVRNHPAPRLCSEFSCSPVPPDTSQVVFGVSMM